MVITGTITAVDAPHTALLLSDVRSGSLTATDSMHMATLQGVVIGDSTIYPSAGTFVQGQQMMSNDISLTLIDSTYIDGSWGGDGTVYDSTYQERLYNPLWLNYSVWFQEPLDKSSETLVGPRNRVALNPSVGQFYVNMYAPEPGDYEIRWRYQKDSDNLAQEIVEPFSVSSSGTTAEPDYT